MKIGEESRVAKIDLFVAIPGMVGTMAGMVILVFIARLIPTTRKSLFPSEQVSWRFRAPHFLALCTVLCVIGTCGFLGRRGDWDYFCRDVITGLICQEQPVDLPCDPFSVWQFHAVWHVTIAFGLASLFMFYRSEFIGFEGEDLTRFVADDDTGCYEKALRRISVSPQDGNKVKIEL